MAPPLPPPPVAQATNPASSVLAVVSSAPMAALGVGLVGARVAGLDLGFECPMWVLFGAACPFCGITRAAAGLATGDTELVATHAPAAGAVVLLALMTVVVVLGWLRGRSVPPAPLARVYLGVLGVVLAVNWVWQLRLVGVL
jgi:hypothetical protein